MPNRATRRSFLKLSAAAASLATAKLAQAATARVLVVLTLDPSLGNTDPIQWANAKLVSALKTAGLIPNDPQSRAAITHTILVGHFSAAVERKELGIPEMPHPETIALIPYNKSDVPKILVTGSDTRGIVYAILELADRIRSAPDPITALHLPTPIIETTPNRVRSVARAFVSEIEDKAWFYDRAFWTNYLDTLVAARFNRFNFTLGIGYDFPRGVTGDYLHFPYPYLVELPNYPGVHVEPALAPGERQRNLEALQFIAAETARRGLDFQLGIWTHAYQWTDSPHSDHTIVGLTPETHAAYCRDALAYLLAACPQITGLTLRIHGESGIPEGSYPFWQTLFEAIKNAGRTVEIDMHAKGLNQIMIDMARKIGMPVKAGAKYWAEHLGLGYQQADIRAAEVPKPGHVDSGTFSLSSGSRSFTRYGYGDFYQYPQGRPAGESIDLLYRVWPGTQKHLLWGDPALAAGYGRAANFCGAAGMELMEPLTFKGREGSGHPGGRDAYADKSLGMSSSTATTPASLSPIAIPSKAMESPKGIVTPNEAKDPPKEIVILSKAKDPLFVLSPPSDLDTAKFTVTYMLWGRYLYNPDTAPDFHHRYLKQVFGPAGPALETALAASSRILPLVTTAWCPSASNHEFWPEMLTPVSLLPYTTKPLYPDSPAPHNVSVISPLDPQLFTTIEQHAENLISGKPDARYNTSEVIQWLELFCVRSANALQTARSAAQGKADTPEFRRAEEDLIILNGLGFYYANLFRTGLFYSIFDKTQDPVAASNSLACHRIAHQQWSTFSARAKSVYASDISYGSTSWRRGNWAERIAAMDSDIAALDEKLTPSLKHLFSPSSNHLATQLARDPRPRPTVVSDHTPSESFHPNTELTLVITTPPTVTSAILWYRHVNQGERWLSLPMQQSSTAHTAAIPAAYTASPYPLQYYFELRTATSATLHPPFNPTLSNQPYFAIHKRS